MAAAEFESTYRWYEEARAGLGDEFLQTAQDMIQVIAEHPDDFQLSIETFAVLYCEDSRIQSSIA